MDIPHERLTAKEFRVFIALASGKRNGVIARETNRCYSTIVQTRRRILNKLGLDSNTDLTRYCAERNMLI